MGGVNKCVLCLSIVLIVFSALFLASCTPQDSAKLEEGAREVTGAVVNGATDIYSKTKDFVTNETEQKEAKISVAKTIAETIQSSNLQEIDMTKVTKYEEYTKMIDNINLIIKIINDKADTELKYLSKDIEAYEKFTKTITKYTPLIDNYNGLIQASKDFNPNKEELANKVIAKATSFTVEAALISLGALHKAVFNVVGDFSRTFGLTTFSRTCPSCVSAVMSTSYWGIKNAIVNEGGELTEKAIR